MKRQNKQAVAAAAVKAASNEATAVEALSNEVAVKKATQPQKSKTKKAPSKKQTQKAVDKSPVHITKDDPEWDDYITGLKKNVEDAVNAGLFNWYLAYIGFIDDPETGLADLYDGEKMFRILVTNGYCPECANNFINEFRNEVNDKGQKKNYLVVTREERDFWCMEDDFMERAPTDVIQLKDYIEKIPYWTAHEHGKKYRLMYQIYTQPKYHEYGKFYFEGINQRYSTYGRKLEKILDIPADIITPLIFIFVRACVHYALFEDEYYLQAQLGVLKKGISMYLSQIKPETKEEHQP